MKSEKNYKSAYFTLVIAMESIRKHNPELVGFTNNVLWDAERDLEGLVGLRSDHKRPERYGGIEDV